MSSQAAVDLVAPYRLAVASPCATPRQPVLAAQQVDQVRQQVNAWENKSKAAAAAATGAGSESPSRIIHPPPSHHIAAVARS